MFKLLGSLMLMLALISLSSCEGGTTISKSLENNSSETIVVKGLVTGDSTIVNPGETQLIFWDDLQGVFLGDDGYTCIDGLDLIEVVISNSKTLIKDILNVDNWIEAREKGTNAEFNCTFSVSDTDIQ